eukprot:scaffold2156_cov430-Prasinococcus_capsulatus_cf.AAC.9
MDACHAVPVVSGLTIDSASFGRLAVGPTAQAAAGSVVDARATSNGHQKIGAPAAAECYKRGGGLCRFVGD